MSIQHYPRIIEEWCSKTGMEPWDIDANANVEIEGTTVGLIYSSEESPETLHAYIDLGPAEYPDIHKTLLELNVEEVSQGNGYFGIHPESGMVVYRVDLRLTDETDGGKLPEELWSYTQSGLERLRA